MMRVPVSRPSLTSAENEAVALAMASEAISGLHGDYISRFETSFAEFCETKHAVSCSSGTAALHLALTALGIGQGDEVLVSTLTNMASFFAVLYCGAHPIPVDIETVTLTMDPLDLAAKVTSKSKAIMPVHLFGHPCDMDAIRQVADAYGLLIIEDCAEAHGALYKNKPVGGLSDAGCFSFFANKILTTGEGGMVTTNDPNTAEKLKSLKSLSFGRSSKFMHEDVGFNYRLTNVQAAIGCCQVDRASNLINMRIQISQFYMTALRELEGVVIEFPAQMPWAKSVYWMFHIKLRGEAAKRRQKITDQLLKYGIETRPGFIPFNLQKIFIDKGIAHPEQCPQANKFAFSTFYLPSGPSISLEELGYVSNTLIKILREYI